MKKMFYLCFVCFFALNGRAYVACEVVRAAFDVGSINTKMAVYIYDTCQERIIAKIEEKSGLNCSLEQQVSYIENFEDNRIGEDIIIEGIIVLKEFKQIAEACGAEQVRGVATSAFRLADNGEKAAARLSTSGIPVTVISQEEEAQLGFDGALAKSGFTREDNVCVWGIGSSSMQMTCSTEGKRASYLSNVASVHFKDSIISHQHSLSPLISTLKLAAYPFGYRPQERPVSPNPISESDYEYALGLAETEGEAVREQLPINQNQILDIGGVHYYSGRGALESDIYTADQIRDLTLTKLNKTDEELGGGDYVATDISNLILVEGMMRGLNAFSIKVIGVNLTEGLTASEQYWD